MQIGGEAAKSLCSHSTCVPSSPLCSPALSAGKQFRACAGRDQKKLARGAVAELTTKLARARPRVRMQQLMMMKRAMPTVPPTPVRMEAMTAPTSSFVLSKPQRCLLSRAEKPATTRRALLIGPSFPSASARNGSQCSWPRGSTSWARPSRVRPCYGVAEAGAPVFPDPALSRKAGTGGHAQS